MANAEQQRVIFHKLRCYEVRMLVMVLYGLGGVCQIRLPHSRGSIIQHQQKTAFALNQVQHFGIVLVIDARHWNSFSLVLCQLSFEN